MVPEGYKLVFEDDFDGKELDLNKWRYRTLGPRSSGFNAKSQVKLENGNLVITQKYFDGDYGLGWYAGVVSANVKFLRGYFEIRCICNEHRGAGFPDPNPFWSAFWLQADHPYNADYSRGGPGGAEIDIIEAVSNTGNIPGVESNIHVKGMKKPYIGGEYTEHPPVFRVNVPDCYTAYHTYALEWTDKVYRFFIDGKLYAETSFGDGVSEVAEELIVSLEPAPSANGVSLDNETHFIVDYVRVYQKEDGVIENR